MKYEHILLIFSSESWTYRLDLFKTFEDESYFTWILTKVSSTFPPHFIQSCLIYLTNGNEVTKYRRGIGIGLCAWIFKSCHHIVATEWIMEAFQYRAVIWGSVFALFRGHPGILPIKSQKGINPVNNDDHIVFKFWGIYILQSSRLLVSYFSTMGHQGTHLCALGCRFPSKNSPYGAHCHMGHPLWHL